MFRIFCCRSRKTSTVEIDRITDSLETCLSEKVGISEFDRFLTANKFEDERRTLEFALKCEGTLREIEKLSPGTKNRELPDKIRAATFELSEMTNDINFTSYQMGFLGNLRSNDINEKIEALQKGQSWATDLLQEIYKVFRKDALGKSV